MARSLFEQLKSMLDDTPEPRIVPGDAFLWSERRQVWLPAYIEHSANPDDFIYCYDEPYDGHTLHIYRHRQTARRFGQYGRPR